jgi:hypothetical protein
LAGATIRWQSTQLEKVIEPNFFCRPWIAARLGGELEVLGGGFNVLTPANSGDPCDAVVQVEKPKNLKAGDNFNSRR